MKFTKKFKALLSVLSLGAIAVIIFSISSIRKSTGIVVPQSRSSLNNLLSNDFSDLSETSQFDKIVERFMRQWEIKGLSLAVMKQNKLVYAKGYGYADEQRQIKTDVSHVFRIASVSKLFTATAIMKLIEDGKLSMNTKVFGEEGVLGKRYKELRDKRMENITVEHLLRHEAGFSIAGGDPMFDHSIVSRALDIPYPVKTENIISYTLARRLGYTPGSSSRYSNVGYLILSEIIEEVSGKSYYEYLKDEVLEPAGCRDIHQANNFYSRRYVNEVCYYSNVGEDFAECVDGSGRMVPKPYGGNDVWGLKGAGSLVASPVELLKFITAIDGFDDRPDILSKASVNRMKDPNNGKPIGWGIATSPFSRNRTGTFSGTSAIVLHQDSGISWAVVTNTSSWVGFRLNNAIMDMMNRAVSSVSKWPDRDLFDAAYVKQLTDGKEAK